MNNELQRERYYAFISYNSADEKWAKWLQHNLEYYHIPSALCKKYPHLPKKIRPVFWDKQDLNGVRLKNILEENLAASKYLILVCSPSSAKSEWVNGEVEAFIAMGKGDHIIPFIVDGEPHAANPEEECFPLALRNLPKSEEIRGVDARQRRDRWRALVDVIATMFGLSINELWRRHARRRRHNVMRWSGVAMVLLMTLVGYFWYTQPKVEYYADWVDVWGVPEGVIPLSKEQVAVRYRSYEFELQRVPFGQKKKPWYNWNEWQVVRVSHVNSAGTPQNVDATLYPDRFAVQEYKYSREDGTLESIAFFDEELTPLVQHEISSYKGVPATLADFISFGKGNGYVTLGAQTTFLNPYATILSGKVKSNIIRYQYVRDEKGRVVAKYYHRNISPSLEDSRVADKDGIFGMSYQLDELGRVVTITYLDEHGEPYSIESAGVSNIYFDNKEVVNIAHRKFTYDEYGNVVTSAFLSADGEYVKNQMGWSYYEGKADENGNIVEAVYMDFVDGKMQLASTRMYDGEEVYYPIFENEYDNRGNRVKVVSKNEWGAKERIDRYKYDNLGRIIEVLQTDRDGYYQKFLLKYDDLGRITKRIHCNRYDDKPVYVEELHYDQEGRPIEMLSFDSDGVLVHMSKYKWEGLNRLVELEMNSYDGYVKYTAKYDDWGNVVEEATWDVDGNPLADMDIFRFLNASEAVRVTYSYDKRGSLLEVVLWNDVGKVVERDEYDYDDYGRIEEQRTHLPLHRSDTVSYGLYGEEIPPYDHIMIINDGQTILLMYLDAEENVVFEKSEDISHGLGWNIPL